MSLSCTQADGDHLAGQVTCPACSMMRRIADAIDDVLEWRGGTDAGDYPFGWPEQDYELIAQSVSGAIGLAALLAVAEAAQAICARSEESHSAEEWGEILAPLVRDLNRSLDLLPPVEPKMMRSTWPKDVGKDTHELLPQQFPKEGE